MVVVGLTPKPPNEDVLPAPKLTADVFVVPNPPKPPVPKPIALVLVAAGAANPPNPVDGAGVPPNAGAVPKLKFVCGVLNVLVVVVVEPNPVAAGVPNPAAGVLAGKAVACDVGVENNDGVADAAGLPNPNEGVPNPPDTKMLFHQFCGKKK